MKQYQMTLEADPNTGTLTLNGEGDPNTAFIFQIDSILTTASAYNHILG